MKKLAYVVVVLFLFVVSASAADFKIGVLAKNGPVKALKQWKLTGDFLTKATGKSFEIIPLGFEKVFPAIQSGSVDFFLVNSSMFVTAQVKYGATPILTMINSRQGKAVEVFGGVIIASSDNDEISNLASLKGKSFMAVKKSSFGGWQMQYYELIQAGINPFKDFASMEFGGKHDNVALAVVNGGVDAGAVRTDTLERLVAAGTLEMEDIKVINKKDAVGFPFVVSTTLYPEWPLAKVKGTSDSVVAMVVKALKTLKKDSPAAKAAKIIGWTAPKDYSPVEALQKELKIGAYSK